jgi:hypothetical protein
MHASSIRRPDRTARQGTVGNGVTHADKERIWRDWEIAIPRLIDTARAENEGCRDYDKELRQRFHF